MTRGRVRGDKLGGFNNKYTIPLIEDLAVYKDILCDATIVKSRCRLCNKQVVAVSGIRLHCRTCFVGNEAFHVNPLERQVIEYLRARPGRPMSIVEIIDQVWYTPPYNNLEEEPDGADNRIKSYICRLRQIIAPFSTELPLNIWISTHWGKGYELRINREFSRINNVEPILEKQVKRYFPDVVKSKAYYKTPSGITIHRGQ